MAEEITENCNTNNEQRSGIYSKFDCEEKENQTNTKYHTEINETNVDIRDQNYKSTSVKSIIKNSVINTGHRCHGFSVSQHSKGVIINQIKRFQTFERFSPFVRRISAMCWHPSHPEIFVAASKGGDLILRNLKNGDEYITVGSGADGTIYSVKCSDEDPYSVFTASLTGRIDQIFFRDRGKTNYFYSIQSSPVPSRNYSVSNWFTSMDYSRSQKLLLGGDCNGKAYIISTSRIPVFEQKKLHKTKITHCEFNSHNSNIFVTASLDHMIKLWDLRVFSSSRHKHPEPMAEFKHEKAIAAAHFSPSNGINLLTTDQYSELCVYSSPLWNEVLKISHPHRHFQHMTQIKAVWHPLEDIIIVGRYPDDNIQIQDSRTIDFYDGINGQLLHQIPSPNENIVSLNAMNSTGEVLAAAAGFSIAFLKDNLILKGERSEPESDEDNEKTFKNCVQKRKRKKREKH